MLGEEALMTIAGLFMYTLLAFLLVVLLLVKDGKTAALYAGSEWSCRADLRCRPRQLH